MSQRSLITVLAACTLPLVVNCYADDKTATLSKAVADLNKKLSAYPFDQAAIRTRPLADEERPYPVTTDEVVSAIENWDREEHPVSDSNYKIFKGIAETRTLPSNAMLGFSVQWRHLPKSSETEARELWVDLDVMTGEKTGYTFRVRNQRLDERPYLELSPGYEWIVAPTPARQSDGTTGGVVFTILDDQSQAFHAVASMLAAGRARELNGVVFDSAGNRLELQKKRVGGHGDMVMMAFRLKDKPSNGIDFFAIEGLTMRGKHQRSHLAVEKAAKQGLHVLPLPVVGRKFDYELLTVDGDTLAAAEFTGKVVIIDCWATWCGPCIRQFPKLEGLYKAHHANGLEIIGVSIDESPKAAKEIYAAKSIPWPLVTVPPDEESRQLWEDAADVQEVPRVLVVDRRGVLRADDSELPVELIVSLMQDN